MTCMRPLIRSAPELGLQFRSSLLLVRYSATWTVTVHKSNFKLLKIIAETEWSKITFPHIKGFFESSLGSFSGMKFAIYESLKLIQQEMQIGCFFKKTRHACQKNLSLKNYLKNKCILS